MPPFGEQLKARVGTELHVSDWLTVTQSDIDMFADVTRDWDYIHNDPGRAASSPWKGTIAHGYFLVSLISYFMRQAGFPMPETQDERMLNYGLDRVRFINPVMIGDEIRGRLLLESVTERRPGVSLVKLNVTCETKRCGDQPHMIAEVLMLAIHGEAVHEAP